MRDCGFAFTSWKEIPNQNISKFATVLRKKSKRGKHEKTITGIVHVTLESEYCGLAVIN